MNLHGVFPRASKDFLDLNRSVPDPQPESALRDEPLGNVKRKKADPRCRVLRYTSYRARLLDTDNLAGGTKYFTDALRQCGVIADDTPKHIQLEVKQIKVQHRSEERTVIELEI